MGPTSILPTPPIKFTQSAALFLDVDGTLLEIVDHPKDVKLTENLQRMLWALDDLLGGALALISGRAIDDLDEIFGKLRLPTAGLHGLERRDANGNVDKENIGQALDEIRSPMAEFAAQHTGILLEDKGSTLALHFRLAPAFERAAYQLVERLTSKSEDLHFYAGKMVFEIKPRHIDKGNAIAHFIAEPPFTGRLPIFLGDDVTDEDGFRYVNGQGGISVFVGETNKTIARYSLSDVSSVHAWLYDFVGNLKGINS